MKIFLLPIFTFIFFSSITFSQYSAADSGLVRTTFARQFDHQIIERYLQSPKPAKAKAALLSIAQSEDTTWAGEIVRLKFSKYYNEICFALGELGLCKISSNFLLHQVFDNRNSQDNVHSALEALGKSGDINSFNLIEDHFSKGNNLNGISISLYNFYIRNIGNKDKIVSMLSKEIKTYDFPSQRNFEAAFALYRTNLPDSLKYLLADEINKFIQPLYIKNKYTEISLPYLLACLRRLKYFPHNFELFSRLLSYRNYAGKVEAVKALIYYPFQNKNELMLYLQLLKDFNSNFAQTAASSLEEIKLDNPLRNFLQQYISDLLLSNKLAENVQGKLFYSYVKLFNMDFEEAVSKYEKIIPDEYFYDACGIFDSSTTALNFLFSKFNTETNRKKISILQSLVNFQNKIKNKDKLNKLLIDAINSDSPALIAIAADGLDSVLILKEKNDLRSIITKQVESHKNDPNFQESIMSLTFLSEKIDTNFYNDVCAQLSGSKFYPVKKFAYKLLNRSTLELSNGQNNFEDFWKNSFRYKYAKVFTSKGSFTIEFLPQFAPISVGNFCYLIKQKFFNNNSFHRVVPGFVIQGGDPEETGWGGPNYDIVSEFSAINFDTGMVGMASAGKDTEGSQWFVTTGNYPHLNGRYTIFGKVVKDLSNVFKIEQGDTVLRIKLI